MKIAYFSAFPLDFGGGFEKYLQEVTGLLVNKPGIEKVTIVTLSHPAFEQLAKKISVTPIYKVKPLYREKKPAIIDRLGPVNWQEIETAEVVSTLRAFDVVYCKNELLDLFLLRKLKTVPIVAGVHTAPFYPIADSLYAKVHNFMYGSLPYRRLAAKTVCAFHVLNDFNQELHQKRFPKKLVKKIFNPFDFNSYRAHATAQSAELSLAKNKRNLVWVGRLTAQKGTSDLKEIIDLVSAATGQDVQWNIVGDGEDRPVIEQLAAANQNVKFWGHIPSQQMPTIYAQSDGLVFTSHNENLPYTLLEMMSFSKPVFAYPIPGVTDILQSGGPGLTADSPEKLAQLIVQYCDNPESMRYDKEGFEEKFSPSSISDQLISLFQQVIQKT